MAINLTKGQRIEIGLTKVGIGLGWDPNAGTGFDKYLWSDSTTTNSLTVDSTTFGLGVKTLWVRVTKDGCDGFDTVNITIFKFNSMN